MAVKTITIDMDAYELLSRHKKPGQSFSRIIKEHFGRRKTARDLVNLLPELAFSKKTLTAVESQLRSRRTSRARLPRL